MAAELRLRFVQGDSVFRLNSARFSDAQVERVLTDYIENQRLRSQWILDSRREGNTIVVEHLFPIDEFVEKAVARIDIDEHDIDALPLTYPIVCEIRSGYLRIHKPLAEKYGALLSDFVRGLWKVLLLGDECYLWDHGYAQCGGAGRIPLYPYLLLEPDEPLIGFYRVDVNMAAEAWLFITPQGLIVDYDDDIFAFNKVDMRNATIPSGLFSFSMLKADVVGAFGEGPVRKAFSPKDLGELDQARADVRTMLSSPHQGRPRRMFDTNPLPWIEVDGEELDYMAQANLERYRRRRIDAGRNPFATGAGQGNVVPGRLENPFADSRDTHPGRDDNPFA